MQKRACLALCHVVCFLCLCVVAYPLALQEVADRVTGKAGLQGGSETKVSCERIGTKVTSAVD